MTIRCGWVGVDEHEIAYHDNEWGRPVHDDNKLFEMLTLEGAQAGLSWLTVLKKRENYRRLFKQFEIAKVAKMTQKDQDRLLQDPGIIRNKLKVASSIANAEVLLKIQKEFGSVDEYFWAFVDHEPIVNNFKSLSELPAQTDLSKKISKDLKKRGCNFVGPTIVYAFMQACGMVNDHTTDCFRHPSNL